MHTRHERGRRGIAVNGSTHGRGECLATGRVGWEQRLDLGTKTKGCGRGQLSRRAVPEMWRVLGIKTGRGGTGLALALGDRAPPPAPLTPLALKSVLDPSLNITRSGTVLETLQNSGMRSRRPL